MERKLLDAHSLAVTSAIQNSEYTATRLKVTNMSPKFIIYNNIKFTNVYPPKGSIKHYIQIVLPLYHWLTSLSVILYNAFNV